LKETLLKSPELRGRPISPSESQGVIPFSSISNRYIVNHPAIATGKAKDEPLL